MKDAPISLAAATVAWATPAEAVSLAAAAGYDAVGVRCDERLATPRALEETARRLEATGLWALDLEVVRIRPGDDAEATRALVAVGERLRARYVLVVSEDPDPGRTTARFFETCELAAEAGLRAALEFMAFTTVRTLAEALAVVEAAGHPAGGVVVDPLHLARSGGNPGELAGVERRLLAYLQLCDAPGRAPTGEDALATEARHHRLLPGTGELPLRAFLAAAPRLAVSVEVPSDELRARHGTALAPLALEATRSLLGEVRGQAPTGGRAERGRAELEGAEQEGVVRA
ncbi:MAG TPA: TIM barrel protein [Acidimicrobiales bacterium]|nr:TIM barrel protein [Acidimicrobiales bacterium]